MASPDITRFVDLTLFDLSSQDLYLRALEYARVALPEFQPREGTIETVLLQAMALEAQEVVSAINRIPGAVTQVLLALLGVDRQDGTFATATVRMKATSTADVFVPKGTRMYYQASLDADPLILATDADVTLTHAKTLTSLTHTSTAVTATTGVPHGFGANGATLTATVSQVAAVGNNANYNGTFTITITSPTTFTYTAGSAPSTDTAGLNVGTVTPAVGAGLSASGYAAVTAQTLTSAFNGLPVGTNLELLSAVPQISTVNLSARVAGGAEPEDDTTYFQRAAGTLTRLTGSLATADQITQYVVGSGRFPSVYRAHTVDLMDYQRQTSTTGRSLLLAAPIQDEPIVAGSSDPLLLEGVGVTNSFTLASISRSSTTVTATATGDYTHLVNGWSTLVTVSGCSNTALNGTFTLTSVSYDGTTTTMTWTTTTTGTITNASVSTKGTVTVTWGTKDDLRAAVQELVPPFAAVQVQNPLFVTVSVAVAVKFRTGIYPADAIEACTAALNAYLSANTWNWANTVRNHEVVSLLRDVKVTSGSAELAAVEYVESVEFSVTGVGVRGVRGAYQRSWTGSYSSPTLTMTVSALPASVSSANGTMWAAITRDAGATWVLNEVGGGGGTTLTTTASSDVGTAGKNFVIPVAQQETATGNLVIFDPAPLVTYGAHVFTVVA